MMNSDTSINYTNFISSDLYENENIEQTTSSFIRNLFNNIITDELEEESVTDVIDGSSNDIIENINSILMDDEETLAQNRGYPIGSTVRFQAPVNPQNTENVRTLLFLNNNQEPYNQEPLISFVNDEDDDNDEESVYTFEPRELEEEIPEETIENTIEEEIQENMDETPEEKQDSQSDDDSDDSNSENLEQNNHLPANIRNVINRGNINRFFNNNQYRRPMYYSGLDRSLDMLLERSLYDQPVYKKIASKKGIKQLKEIIFDSSLNQSDTCPITQDKFINGETIIELPCSHMFSKEAIMEWVTKENACCPICRFELNSKEEKIETTPEIAESNNDSNYNPYRRFHRNYPTHTRVPYYRQNLRNRILHPNYNLNRDLISNRQNRSFRSSIPEHDASSNERVITEDIEHALDSLELLMRNSLTNTISNTINNVNTVIDNSAVTTNTSNTDIDSSSNLGTTNINRLMNLIGEPSQHRTPYMRYNNNSPTLFNRRRNRQLHQTQPDNNITNHMRTISSLFSSNIRQAVQEDEEQMLQEAIMNSLLDTDNSNNTVTSE